ncbi:MAG: endolytic transglycosylase MltG [Bacteroidetes bacterium]|nr:endolytic transglycosylase MltG [Bacteroidota bacterium]
MKNKKIFLVGLIVFSVMLTSFTFYAWQILFTPNILVDQEARAFTIRPGESFKQIQNRLYDERIVQEAVSFGFLARLMKYDESVKAGYYVLEKNMSNLEAIRLLRSGRQTPIRITFNNIRTRNELAERLGDKLMFSRKEMDSLLHSPAVAQEYGLDTATIITLFIPNTYEFYWNTTARDFMDRMKEEYDNFWTPERLQKAEQRGMTPSEVYTLASIVKAETNKVDEMPRVAGVYLNRLNRNMPLQADPTLVYALGDFGIKRILNKDKEIDSPYNTYMYRGLPPGPINMPPIAAVDAVLNAEQHKYYYFVARDDLSGYHTFSANYNEHLKNARKYQKALNKRGILR